jgi:hypothetical protein
MQMSARSLSFVVTDNEWRKSRQLPNYHLYLVQDCESARPKVYSMAAEDVPEESLRPQSYRAFVSV